MGVLLISVPRPPAPPPHLESSTEAGASEVCRGSSGMHFNGARFCPHLLEFEDSEMLPLSVTVSRSLPRGLHWGHLFQF